MAILSQQQISDIFTKKPSDRMAIDENSTGQNGQIHKTDLQTLVEEMLEMLERVGKAGERAAAAGACGVRAAMFRRMREEDV